MALLLSGDGVFLHLPKTGGTWVTSALEDMGLIRCHFAAKHADMERAMHCLRDAPGRYVEAVFKAGPLWQRRVRRGFKFCFVRHPLSWYESWWIYMSGRNWNPWGVDPRGRARWHPNAAIDGLGDPDFNRFVRNVLEQHPGYVSALYASYATAAIDYVGKQERLADDLIAVLGKLGVDFDAARVRARPPVNASSERSTARPVWDAGLRRDVEASERSAIQCFGY